MGDREDEREDFIRRLEEINFNIARREVEEQIQSKLQYLTELNKSYFGPISVSLYLLQIDRIPLNCELIPINKYSEKHLYTQNFRGIYITQKTIPPQNLLFKFSELEEILTIYEGNIYQIK